MDYQLPMLGIFLIMCLDGTCQTISHEWGSVTSGEYCDYENFSAQCKSGYTLQVVQALYGQMELGKCLKVDAYLGCQTDVTEIMRQKCNSHNRCEMDVRDKILRDTQPCEIGVLVYMNATFACIKENVHRTIIIL
ncbi:hypothetical protein CAPTEDRAFT_192082 [Capitella teleta]|uniref:SUEL-type lectin domain-containing protein n=1 Tax=Capitella teleta TaxID=283909 RepID=R7VF08_CAPTE|nr:hypothetical protein CAPTEDRAFT_192082 [Capitella teleta]|eukprot:ELU14896.1 hypothetical protein CAPTEDRAFT_192082 [Capitella teleta]